MIEKQTITQIEQILNEVETISDSYLRVAEATGENFNIFSILGMETKEVSTHSKFIAELLNPKGNHGQNGKFLSIFIDLFYPKLDFNIQKYEVFIEYYIGKVEIDKGGRLDILIKDNDGNVLMIENKIYASEEENQLLRYHHKYPKGELLYLTLYGDSSTQSSAKDLYKPLSYETDIINWLEECKKESVNLPILRETISQYIYLVKKLTGQNLNKKMSQDIVKRVLKDKGSFDSYKALVQSKKEVFLTVLEDNVLPVLIEIKDEYQLTLELNKDKFLSGAKSSSGFSFSNESLNNNNLKVDFQFQGSNHSNLIFGYSFLDGNNKRNEALGKIKSAFENKYPQTKSSNSWLCYTEYKGYNNWTDLEILKKIKFDDFSSDLKAKVQSMIEFLK